MITLDDVRAGLDDRQILALTIWGEASNQPVEGKIAVGCVIRNRLRSGRWGESYLSVCLAPMQFSCWSPKGGIVNHERVMAQAERMLQGQEILVGSMLDECAWIADGLVSRRCRDRVGGALFYYAPQAMVPPGRVPFWAQGRPALMTIGDHVFFA